jgi:protein transport protein SEC61 subunit gamma-like protein
MNIGSKIKKELYEYKRILTISNKPSTEEFLSIAKICAIGMGLIGFLGFLIQLIGSVL